MYPKGLKTSIVVNLLFIIAAAMLLVDLVLVGSARQELLKTRYQTADLVLTVAGPMLMETSQDADWPTSTLNSALNAAKADCVVYLNSKGKDPFSAGQNCESIEILKDLARQTIASGSSTTSFQGVTKGILWPDRKNMLVARPLFNQQKGAGAMVVALDLSGIYTALRSSQKIFFVYFLVNLLAFSMLGFYHLYRWLLKPINRLLTTAEGFRDDEDITFLPEVRDGEFNRLSTTLNKMFAKINRDRGSLQKTISDLEEANLKLRKTQQEMVRTEKMASVGHLSAGIAHEIGNPIGIVIGYLDLLKNPSLADEQKKDFIDRAEREVSRVSTIIRQLLDFARQPSDEQPHAISVQDNINEVIEICSVQPMMTGILMVVEATSSADMVIGTSGHLKQVFLNLLINAADAINSKKNSREKGLITIKTTNIQQKIGMIRQGFVQIEFIDNGPGIETANIDEIFDPFFTTKEPGKGTGLGLSICFTLIENMAGSIKAESDNGGTTITVTLPLPPDIQIPET